MVAYLGFFSIPTVGQQESGAIVEETHLLIGGNIGNVYLGEQTPPEYAYLIGTYDYWGEVYVTFNYEDSTSETLSVSIPWDWSSPPGDWTGAYAYRKYVGSNPMRCSGCTMFEAGFMNPNPAKKVVSIKVNDDWVGGYPWSDVFALTVKSPDVLKPATWYSDNSGYYFLEKDDTNYFNGIAPGGNNFPEYSIYNGIKFYTHGNNDWTSYGRMDLSYDEAVIIDTVPFLPSDTTPPATNIALSGTPGNNGWYTSDVQVTLTATDNEGGSGVAKTEYMTQRYAVSPSGIVGWWPFDETSGTKAEDIWGDNPGTVYGGANWVADGVSNALTFDGIDDYVDVGNSLNNHLQGRNELTVSAWVKRQGNLPRYAGIVDIFHAAGDKRMFAIMSHDSRYPEVGGDDNKVYFLVYTDTGYAATPPTQDILPLNEWAFLTLVYDGSMLRGYVNGVEVVNAFASGALQTTTEPLRIGLHDYSQSCPSCYGTTAYFNGFIDEVQIYNQALSASEVLSLFAAGRTSWTTYTAPFTISAEGTTTVYYRSADNAGNIESTKSQIISIDRTSPQITINTPANGGMYLLNQALSADWSVMDALSGIASATGTLPSGATIDTGTVGTKTFTVTATDSAGNTATQSSSYTIAYDFLGILPPIRTDGSSIFNLGRTVPVKFRIADANGNYVSTATASLTYQKITDEILGNVEEAVSTSAASEGNTFRYDSTDNLYIFNLGTEGMSTGTYQLNINLDDGTVHTVRISLR